MISVCALTVHGHSFKLHFQPNSDDQGLQVDGAELSIDDLPEGKMADDVMSDYMRYLVDATRESIELTCTDGERKWKNFQDDKRIHFIFGIPNGWVGEPQDRMRRCAVTADLVATEDAAQKIVEFVPKARLAHCHAY